jgi:hypothetical protein
MGISEVAAMSRSLEARISRLEQLTGKGRDALSVILIRFVGGKDGRPEAPGELYGYESGHYGPQIIQTLRRPGESDDDLLARAEAATPAPGPVRVLHELRA